MSKSKSKVLELPPEMEDAKQALLASESHDNDFVDPMAAAELSAIPAQVVAQSQPVLALELQEAQPTEPSATAPDASAPSEKADDVHGVAATDGQAEASAALTMLVCQQAEAEASAAPTMPVDEPDQQAEADAPAAPTMPVGESDQQAPPAEPVPASTMVAAASDVAENANVFDESEQESDHFEEPESKLKPAKRAGRAPSTKAKAKAQAKPSAKAKQSPAKGRGRGKGRSAAQGSLSITEAMANTAKAAAAHRSRSRKKN